MIVKCPKCDSENVAPIYYGIQPDNNEIADQIGKLAADSANSAVNTRELIDKTLVEIQKGNEITITTAEAFNQIISDMNSFAEMAQNTMEKANTQAESLEQIGQGIEQLSGVVQGTAASSEENTAISINLAEVVLTTVMWVLYALMVTQ